MHTARRSFFKKLFAESIGVVEEMKGIPQFRLDKIQELPDKVVEEIVPVALTQDMYHIEGNRLIKNMPGGNAQVVVRTFNPDEVFILSLFNGRNPLRSVAALVAKRNLVPDPEPAFKKVKAIFVEVARLMVYVPAGKHEREEAGEYPEIGDR